MLTLGVKSFIMYVKGGTKSQKESTVETKTVGKADIIAFRDLVGGALWFRGMGNTSKLAITFNLENGVEATLNMTALLVTRDGTFYGRDDNCHTNWNAARIKTYWGEAFNMSGKGSRSVETAKMARETLEVLTGAHSNY